MPRFAPYGSYVTYDGTHDSRSLTPLTTMLLFFSQSASCNQMFCTSSLAW